MILKILIFMAVAAFAVALFTGGRRKALHAGWFVGGGLVLLVLLAIQILRTLDTMWR